jgi:hypothetical protein
MKNTNNDHAFNVQAITSEKLGDYPGRFLQYLLDQDYAVDTIKLYRQRIDALAAAMHATVRGEQPAVFCRTVILTAFQNSASRAQHRKPDLLEQRRKPDLLELSPTEQQKALLQALSLP